MLAIHAETIEERRDHHRQTIKEFEEFFINISGIKNPDLLAAIDSVRKSIDGIRESPINKDCLENLVKCLESRSGNEREATARTLEVIVICDVFDMNPSQMIALLLPELEVRFANGDRREKFEEIRLLLVRVLRKLLDREEVHNELLPHLNSIVNVLKWAIGDEFPDVKRIACQCVTSLTRTEPKNFHLQSRSLIKPLVNALKHKHSAVRISAVGALGALVQYGNFNEEVREVCSHLSQRVMDDNPRVRLCVAQQLQAWMINLPDRYSFYDIFIPLLLSSNIDESCTVSEASIEMWHEVGRKYEEDNYSQLKEELDFESETHPPWYPKEWKWPPLGCRKLVKQHAARIVPAVLRDMKDWLETTRLKSVHLLHVLILNCEENVTQHVPALLPALVQLCCEEPQEFSHHIICCAELMGNFAHPVTWCESVLDHVEDGRLPHSLIVLDALLRGTRRRGACEVLLDLSQRLLSSNICHIGQEDNLQWLLRCVKTIICLVDANEQLVMENLFLLICQVKAVSSDKDIVEECAECFSLLANCLHLPDVQNLFENFFQVGISYFKKGYQHWTVNSPNCFAFLLLLHSGGGRCITADLERELLTVLLEISTPEKRADIRLKIFVAVAKLFEHSGVLRDDFVVAVVQDIFLPNLKWQPGRTASALLSCAISCLSLVFQAIKSYPSLDGISARILPLILPELLAAVHNDHNVTRYHTCRILEFLTKACDAPLAADKLENISVQLLERLDDVDDEVRFAAADALGAVIECAKKIQMDETHLNKLQQGFKVYLSDENEAFRDKVSSLLQSITTKD